MVGFLYSVGKNVIKATQLSRYSTWEVNLGALISPIIVGGLGDTGNPANFIYGFLAAGIGMLIGLTVFILGKNKYLVDPDGNSVGEAPKNKFDTESLADKPLTSVDKQRMGVIVILAFFGIFFWAAFEQAGVSLTFLAEQHVDRVITSLNFVIPTAWFQSVNPLAILIFAPFFAAMWLHLKKREKNLRFPLKWPQGYFYFQLDL